MSANGSTRRGPTTECIQVYYTGLSLLKAGDALHYDWDASDTSVQNYNVEDPSLNNSGHFAGVVADGQTSSNLQGPCLVNIEVPTNVPVITTVRSNLSITAGDLLAPLPGTRTWAKWCGIGRPLAQALETVDRSTTAGRVRVRYGNLNLSESFLASKCTRFFDDFLGFAEPVAADVGTYLLSGTSVAASFTDDIAGGVLGIVTNTTNNGQIALNGEPFSLAANKTCWFRARFKVSSIASTTNTFVGLSITDTAYFSTKPNDYMGFESNDGVLTFNYVKDGTTGVVSQSTGVTLVADTFVDVAFFFDGNGNVYIYVNETQVAHTTTTTEIVNDEALTLIADVVGGAARTLSLDRWEVGNAR